VFKRSLHRYSEEFEDTSLRTAVKVYDLLDLYEVLEVLPSREYCLYILDRDRYEIVLYLDKNLYIITKTDSISKTTPRIALSITFFSDIYTTHRNSITYYRALPYSKKVLDSYGYAMVSEIIEKKMKKNVNLKLERRVSAL
jgi:hypothetical protein